MYDTKAKYKPEFLREMPPRELELLAGEAGDTLFVLRHQTAVSLLNEKPHLRGKIRRDIARIKTIIGERGRV